MRCGRGWTITALALTLGSVPGRIAAQESADVGDIEDLQGVPAYPNKMSGALRIRAGGLLFVARRGTQFTLRRESVDYIAAHEQARQRALMTDVGSVSASLVAKIGTSLTLQGLPVAGIPALGAAPFLFLLREKGKYLLSVEYLEGEQGTRRLALFRVRNNSASTVKKLVDTSLGLTADHYRNKDRNEEAHRREFERRVSPAGFWEAPRNTVIGDDKGTRILVEKNRYAVLVCYRYTGLKLEDMSWAKYRIPVREAKAAGDEPRSFAPIFKGKRLVGFEINGNHWLFY